MTATRLDGSIELWVILGNGVEDDHELTKDATKHSDDGLTLLRPAIRLRDLLLQNLFNC